MKKLVTLVFALLITGCASYDGRGLTPGVSSREDVIQLMGEPAMRWQEPGGGQLLAFPRGPAGFNTYMVTIAGNGLMSSLQAVLNTKHFALIREGMTEEQVLRILGPSTPQWTVFFDRSNELVWEWRFCNAWNEPSRFDVLFDGTTKRVRTTQSYPESMTMLVPPSPCGNQTQ